MVLQSQNLTGAARVDPSELYRVTLVTEIPCPAGLTDISGSQRCIDTRGAHERIVADLRENQLKPDGIFALPTIANMRGEPQLAGFIGGTRMVSEVIGNPTRPWLFSELRGQVSFLGRGKIDEMKLERSNTTGSVISDAANAVEDTVEEVIERVEQTADSLPSLRTVLLVGGAVAGLVVGAKVVRLFS